MLFVNRLVTDSTLQDVVLENANRMQESLPPPSGDIMADFTPSNEMDVAVLPPPTKFVQCRLCHEEDEESNMEIPCSCCGSLKVKQWFCHISNPRHFLGTMG